MQILYKESERGERGRILIDGIILYSLHCKMTKDNVSDDEKQTPSPSEIILKPEQLQETIISWVFSPVFSVGISLREREAFMKILHAPMLRKVRNNMIVPPQQPLRC